MVRIVNVVHRRKIWLFGLIVMAAGVFAQSLPSVREYSPPYYVFSPDIPHDIVTDIGAQGIQPYVDILAWDTFIAINWPVPNPVSERGIPDRQNVIGGYKKKSEGTPPPPMPTGPVVWETFMDASDLFLESQAAPPPFDTPESIPGPCEGTIKTSGNTNVRTLNLSSKISDVLHEDLEAFVGAPLIDQNGEKVWYEIKVNRAYYDYVVNNMLYKSAVVKKMAAKNQISFPSSSNTTGNDPVVKIKAAWKIMGAKDSHQPDDPSRFYTTEAYIYDPQTKKCSKQQIGLVGLHVVMKTEQLPQWMWATFEHVDNAPDYADYEKFVKDKTPLPKKKYNFFNPKSAGSPVNATGAMDSVTPTQVVRIVPVASNAGFQNSSYQSALKTLRNDNVWKNYMLVNAQWAANRDHIGVPQAPKFLANTTMETYLQEPIVNKQAPHGCINCHGGFASSTDLDFQLP